jgi:hypothetical protein
VAPETVALVLSVAAVWLVAGAMAIGPDLIDTSRTPAGGQASTATTAPSAAPSAGGGATVERPPAELIAQGMKLNDDLVTIGNELEQLLANDPTNLRLAQKFRSANLTLRSASAWAAALSRAPSGQELGHQLAIVYEALGQRLDTALDRPLGKEYKKDYRADARRLVRELGALATFESGLKALLG